MIMIMNFFGHDHDHYEKNNVTKIRQIIGDYHNSFFSLNAQITQIFGLAKSIALPPFLAKSGYI